MEQWETLGAVNSMLLPKADLWRHRSADRPTRGTQTNERRPSIINTAVSSSDRSRASSSLSACSVAALNRRDTADFDGRLAVHADGSATSTWRRWRPRRASAPPRPGAADPPTRTFPRRQLDLATVDVTAPGPGDGDLLRAEHDLTGRRAMPVPDPSGQLGVLRPDDRGQLLGEHLLHHHQPGRRRERQQPFTHRGRDISHRHGRLQRQAGQLAGGIRGRDLHDRYLLHDGDPSPCSGVLVDSRTLPARHGPGRDHHLTSTSSGSAPRDREGVVM